MQDWMVDLLALMGGFVFLAKGATWLVDGGSSLARKWGVQPLLVGLTVVAWGTSMPEVVVSGLAAVEGKPGTSLGNVLGSNVANIGLVLGVSAWVLPAILVGRIDLRERAWLLGSLLLLWGVCYDGTVTRADAGILLGVFVVYNIVLFKGPREPEAEILEQSAVVHVARRPWTCVIVGSIGIAGGAKLVMVGAEGLAELAGLSQTVIGLTVLAVGTSLPELAAGISSALKGHAELSFGNVIGSNVFNSLAVIGVVGLIQPLGSGTAGPGPLDEALARDFPVNLGFALALVLLPKFMRGRAGRLKAGILFAAYAAYMTWIVI